MSIEARFASAVDGTEILYLLHSDGSRQVSFDFSDDGVVVMMSERPSGALEAHRVTTEADLRAALVSMREFLAG